MRLIVVAMAALLMLSGCAKNEPVADQAPKSSDEPLKQYTLKGQVKRLDAENKIAAIQHEAIGDWMGPMTMEFPVKDSADFGKLSEDKPVEATVYVQGLSYWVANVK